ncbi:IPT/TIG domain-containing protein [Coraliomargarita sp. W4R72]
MRALRLRSFKSFFCVFSFCILLVGSSAFGQSIKSISPTSGSSTGGYLITITGVKLDNPDKVSLGGRTVKVKSSNGSTIVGVVPPGEGLNQAVVVKLGKKVTSPQKFSYKSATISELKPSMAKAAGGVTGTLPSLDAVSAKTAGGVTGTLPSLDAVSAKTAGGVTGTLPSLRSN